MSDKDKIDDRRPPPERTGHVKPADPELVKWLERLWTRDTPPDRMEVWLVLGVNKDVRRALIFYENFKQDKPLNIEECTRLAGEILSAAQNWTDSKRRLCFFEISVTDYYQQTVPLARPFGPLLPQRAYAGVHPDGGPIDEDEDSHGEIGLKPLSHQYLSKTIRSMHRAMEQVHVIIGDTMRLQQAIMVSQQSHNERLQNANMALYEQKQTAEDRATERAMWLRREEMKIRAIGSGLKVGENLLYGWFGMAPEPSSTADKGSGQAAGQGTEGQAAARLYPASAEQRLVDSFLEEAADEKLSMQLFGDWKDANALSLQEVFAGLGLEKPGIFSPQQFGILVAVRARILPPDALDALIPEFNQPAAITLEQLARAAPLITQGMRVALDQVRSLRLAAREKLIEQQPQSQPQPKHGEQK